MQTADAIQVISVVFSLLALVISGITFFSTRQYFHREVNHRLTDRIYELNKLIIENPSITKFMYEKSFHIGQYFVATSPHDDLYFQAKAWIYFHIDYFDEVFSIVSGDAKLKQAIEFEDWKSWIIKKMRHPLYKEIYERESSMWGNKFRDFIHENHDKLREPPDPEIL